MRDDILKLLNGEKIASTPAFSGLIHVTAEGLKSEGLSLKEVHHDAEKMARAATSTFKLTGMPSAALPLDLCSPAEALGAELIFYDDEEMQFPQVKKLLFQSTKEILELERLEIGGRIHLICDAIQLVKKDIGDKVVISGVIPGPYTLMIYICKVQNLFGEMKKEPQMVLDALTHLSSFLAEIGNAYLQAGADFITIHEMGGSPGFIGPAKFEQFVLPPLQALHKKINGKRVLSVCGKTDAAMSLLAQAGADAISVDQLTDLSTARAALKDIMLFGNVDPVATLWQGDEGSVAEAVQKAKEAGVDAIWPGCDMVIQTPTQNLLAMMKLK
jgi:[methyl-Co(III) methanol-specific corrinoid protein]:coenzyme M methyltransferase